MHQDIRIFPFHTPGNFFHRKALSCLVIYRHDRHQQSILIHCMNHIIRLYPPVPGPDKYYFVSILFQRPAGFQDRRMFDGSGNYPALVSPLSPGSQDASPDGQVIGLSTS